MSAKKSHIVSHRAILMEFVMRFSKKDKAVHERHEIGIYESFIEVLDTKRRLEVAIDCMNVSGRMLYENQITVFIAAVLCRIPNARVAVVTGSEKGYQKCRYEVMQVLKLASEMDKETDPIDMVAKIDNGWVFEYNGSKRTMARIDPDKMSMQILCGCGMPDIVFVIGNPRKPILLEGAPIIQFNYTR